METNEEYLEDVIPPATSTSDVNIHLAYLRRDIRSLAKKIDDLDDHYITDSQFSPVSTLVAAHDTAIRELNSFKDGLNGKLIGFAAASAVFSSVLTIVISHYWR